MCGMNDSLLTRGVEEVIVKDHLEAALKSGKKLRVKFGIDPTAPDLHLGHTVPLRKLRQFQDAGHTAVLIIGDFTAMIGDPTGRSEERMPLSTKEVKQNMKKYLKQAGKILNVKKAEVHYNSKWLNKSLDTIIEISRVGTIQQVLHRADFKKRIDEGSDITLLEVMYPLFQGYDSVKVEADVEIGGTDQKFNLLMGRRVQRHFKMPEQDMVTVPLLEGTDGNHKMSKSKGNYIAIDEAPDEMFGKIMRIPDILIDKYYNLLTDADRSIQDPLKAKLELAKVLVTMYHGEKSATKAQEEFIKIHSEHGKPTDRPRYTNLAGKSVLDAISVAGIISSRSEARRLIEQGAVRINDKKVSDPNEIIPPGATVQVGPRRFFDT
ncbi:MAG: tyrosyl-tRNA synthetase [Parcubacteria group bacterium Gr01-1014_3]|nr:MAG: tyrosyl-tRNA synthetase [Parcubacteria group bacterium Gr01-1014_3]